MENGIGRVSRAAFRMECHHVARLDGVYVGPLDYDEDVLDDLRARVRLDRAPSGDVLVEMVRCV